MKKILRQSKTRILIPLLLLSLTLLFCSTTVSAAPGDAIYVNGSSGNDSWDGLSATHTDGTLIGPKLSIKNATKTVNTGGTIHIANGQYKDENNTGITIDKNMNIIGESQTGTIINGTGTSWIFRVNGGITVTLTNLTLTNATRTSRGFISGGAIYNEGTLTVTNCTFTNNKATDSDSVVGVSGGGAITNQGTIISLSGCNFTNNNAINNGDSDSVSGGGAINNQGTISNLSNCTFTNNTATNCGGAINNRGTITSLSGCNFTNNNAWLSGGAIYNYDSTFSNNDATISSLSGCTFTGNTAADNGGAIRNFEGTLNMSGCTFTNNTAAYGGAIANYDSGTLKASLTANYNRFYNNTATTSGNAIYCDGGSVNATLNWWGSNTNPMTNLIIVNRGSVDASTWVILTVNANPTIIYNTQTSVITADFNHYTNSSGNIKTLTEYIPDGIPVIFSLTGDLHGNFNGLTFPITLFTSGGLTSISFNAASVGIQNIEAAADNEKVGAIITINEVASIGDFVWNDIDKDGIQDAGEPGIAGVTVNLYNSTGQRIATTTTNANGYYQFSNIIPGTYSLDFVLPGGYLFSSQNQGADDTKDSDADVTTGKTAATTLLSGENDVTWDAGIYWIAPVANPDIKSVGEDNTITDSVADNDTPSMGLNTWILVSGPAHGTLGFNSNGSFTYTPDPNYHGPDSFTYHIQDSHGATSATVTVSITVNSVNDVPVAVDDTATIDEDTSLTGGNVAGNDTPSGDGGNVWSVVSGPDHGTLVMNADGTYTYTPHANYNGQDQFTYQIKDIDGDTSTANVVITINSVNDAPMAVNDGASTDEDNSVDVDVLSNDTDVDTGDSKTINSFTQPGNGTTSLVDGKIRYTPNPNWYGTDTFTYTTRDSSGAISNTATVTITVNPVNDAPTVGNYSVTTQEDTTTSGTVVGSDVDNSLTYSLGTQALHGTAIVNPDGTWTYTPNANYNGPDSFTVLVNDGNGGTAVSTVNITVNSVNDIPVAQNDAATTKESKPININVLGNDSDADGDSLTITNVTQPNHGTATINADGTVTYTPNSNWYGTDSFTYTISDGNGGTSTATVNITVSQAVSDLYIKTTTNNPNPTTGDTFEITYKLGNYGPDEAENVTITFQIPEGLDFANIKVDTGKYTYNPTTRTVTWTLDSVPVGDPYLYLTVKAADEGTYKITPNVTSDTYNSNTGDDGIITFNIQANNSNSGNGTGTNTVKAATKTTIGLQDTGLPFNYLILAILMIVGCLVPKRK